jgi:hypothetical protein
MDAALQTSTTITPIGVPLPLLKLEPQDAGRDIASTLIDRGFLGGNEVPR